MSTTVTQVAKPLTLVPFKSIERFQTHVAAHPAAKTSAGRIMQVFLNVDMRYGHDGLEHFARQRSIDVNALAPGQYVVFVNTAKDRIKVYATGGVVAYKRLLSGQTLDLRVIQEIPRAFNSHGTLDLDKALQTAVESAFVRRSARATG